MKRQRGAAFLIALFAMMLLVAVVASLASHQQLVIQAQTARMEKRRAQMAAEAGVQRAIEILEEKLSGSASSSSSTSTSSSSTTGAYTLSDDWATLGNNGADSFVVGSTSFRIQIVDEASFIDINTATEEQLEKLPLTETQIESILDWRETATTSTRTNGAKDEYYNNLTNPYNTALKRFETLDELLLVRDVTAQVLYESAENQTTVSTTPLLNLPDGRTPRLADILCVNSKSPQTTVSGENRINVNTQNSPQSLIQRGFSAADAQAIIPVAGPRPTYATLGEIILRPGLSQTGMGQVLDNLTVDGSTTKEGKLNLNTVSETVLNTVPNLTSDIASAIISRQSAGFTALSDLLSIPGLNSASALAPVADAFTVVSQTFLVRVVGKAGSSTYALEAEIDTSSGTPKITRMTEQPFTDMPTRWGWTDSGTNSIVLKEAA